MKKGADPERDLVRLFGSVSRARILGLLYAFRGQLFYQREIMFKTNLTLRGVQRELNNLVALGIVKTQRTNNKVYYEINPDSTFFKPLQDIFSSISPG